MFYRVNGELLTEMRGKREKERVRERLLEKKRLTLIKY
jgi:hypothetical protein